MRDFALPTCCVYLYLNVIHITNGIEATNSAYQQLHCYGRGYLDHVEQEIKAFVGKAKRILFFPYALYDRDACAAKAKARFAVMGYSLEAVHQTAGPRKAVENTDAFFVGGGNTFRLLKALQDFDLLDVIRHKVQTGAPYIDSSAGSNVAGPTIKTTKDMPIMSLVSGSSKNIERIPFEEEQTNEKAVQILGPTNLGICVGTYRRRGGGRAS